MKRLLLWLILLLSVSTVSAQRGVYSLPEPYGDIVMISSTITRTGAGRIFASNTLTDTVTLFDLDRSILAEFAIGSNPKGVAIVPDNRRALAVSDSSLAVINLDTNELSAGYDIEGYPVGIVSDNEFAYISLQEANEVIVVNLEDGAITTRIPTPNSPSGLAKWGDFLYVTHFWTGEFSLIYLPTAQVVRTIQPNLQGSLAASVEINPINGLAYLPQTIANTDEDATSGNRMIPMLYEIDLALMAVTRSINLSAADQNINLPIAVRQPSNRSRLYIAQAGSQSVTVLNLDTGEADAHFETGNNPRGIVFSRDFTQVYIQDNADASVSLFDTLFFGLTDQFPLSTMEIDPLEQIGTRLFYTATDTRLSNNGLMRCASCHWAGRSDGRIWSGTATPAGQDFTSLDRDWLNQHIATLQGGTGFAIDSLDMDALISYLEQYE
ncbi:MAG: hypothetical protein WBC91_13045 [Phototrophicaceae bacterium]